MKRLVKLRPTSNEFIFKTVSSKPRLCLRSSTDRRPIHFLSYLSKPTWHARHYSRGRHVYEGQVEIEIDGKKENYNSVMLRDGCGCDRCFDSITGQRVSFYNTLPEAAFVAVEIRVENDQICITWADDHVTIIAASQLTGAKEINKTVRSTWDASRMKELGISSTPVSLLTDNCAISKLAEDLYTYGVAMVTRVEATVDATMDVARKLSVVMETFYGSHWTFGTAANTEIFADSAYSTSALTAHTDGTYFTLPPAIQVFHCLHNNCVGGDTLLVDGYHVVDTLKKEYRAEYDLLCDYIIEHRYIDGERLFSSRNRLIQFDPENSFPTDPHPKIIRFNPYDRSTQKHNSELLPLFYTAYRTLYDLVNDPVNSYWLRLEPGQVIFIDNWRVLHGRSEFKGRRLMTGCYLQRDDWISKLKKR